jgi:hypothetical protein
VTDTDWVAGDIVTWLAGLGANSAAVSASLAALNMQWSPNYHHQNPIAAAICAAWGSCPAVVSGTNVIVDGNTIALPTPVQNYLAGI